MPRFYCPTPLVSTALLDLPEGAARHVQVLRLQPGDAITLFNGVPDAQGCYGECAARVTHMGRSSVQVQVGEWTATARESQHAVHLAVGMPANERMDWLVEKAAELGVASIQPLMTERSVLRLSGERASKKQVHWQSVAVAACEQCGGNRIPHIHAVMNLPQWLKTVPEPMPGAKDAQILKLLLSLRAGAQSLTTHVHDISGESAVQASTHIVFLSGSEGGLSEAEETAATATGFLPTTLGSRVLRAETAALVALAKLL